MEKDLKYLFKGRGMKEAREAAGLTQNDMRKLIGICLRQYCRWEAGAVALKKYQVERLNQIYSNHE
jgi:DNA-binding XRE family transcriptional regulator